MPLAVNAHALRTRNAEISLASPDFVAHSTGEKPQAPERPCPQQRGQGRSGELVHFSQRSPDLLVHLLHLPRSDAAHGYRFNGAGIGDVLAFSVHRGAVLAADSRAGGKVAGRGEVPAVLGVKAEREVPGVVILIARLRVENHEAHHAFDVALVLREAGRQADEVFIVEAWETVRSVQESAGCVRVYLQAVVAVEAFDAEIARSIL